MNTTLQYKERYHVDQSGELIKPGVRVRHGLVVKTQL